ncbi:hypothetical protein [Levilactobacillus humaensis]|uniref:hypothetical protein n=1 Tax=Levilactobacillus humaensis TaxID=2950375 RepID=UPI0021C3F386|nr:hypothetical protein [Levilactobacillus humaensis]
MIDTLLGLSFIVFMVLGGIWYNARKHKTPSKVPGKYVLYSLGVLVVIFFISTSLSKPSNNSSSSTAESSSTKKASNNTQDENDALQKLSGKELRKYNSSLIDSLNEEQQWANDGKNKYNESLYIDNLKYDSSRGLLVYVSDEFTTLKNTDRSAVSRHAQQLANAQVVILGKEVNEDSMPVTSIYHGSEKIGRSKALSGNLKFKWIND